MYTFKVQYYNKIKKINVVLLKRYGKGILTFLNIFYASFILLLIFCIFNIIKTTTPELSKQLIVVFIIMFFIFDVGNALSFNVDTVLSISFLKIYPISTKKRLELIYFCFLKHSRSIIYILPASYIGYKLIGSPVSFAILILGLVVLYLIATLLITLLFYLLDIIKYRYGIKNIALFFLPIFLLPTFLGDAQIMFDNFLINFIYHTLLKLVA